jgi:hypothetical protein
MTTEAEQREFIHHLRALATAALASQELHVCNPDGIGARAALNLVMAPKFVLTLLDRLENAEVEVARLNEDAAMACESPCGGCCGCKIADERNGHGGS